jgi:hypothetical protein
MYIPKNKIRTNLYTDGYEFQYLATGELYIGHYHSLYNGKFFSGKNPNDSDVYEIIRINDNKIEDVTFEEQTTNKIALFLEDGDPEIATPGPDEPQIWIQEEIINYLKTTNQSTTNEQPKDTPLPYYPSPTKDQYNFGSFIRYFLVKVNENRYIEVDKPTYTKILNKNSSWVHELYTPFQFPWTLTGEEKEVELVNYKIVLLTEKRLKRQGLKEFLKGKYLKFYKS